MLTKSEGCEFRYSGLSAVSLKMCVILMMLTLYNILEGIWCRYSGKNKENLHE